MAVKKQAVAGCARGESALSQQRLATFMQKVLEQGVQHYRDFEWRNTRDPYAILISEIMLQQTQVTRVVDYYKRWLDRYPSIDALAAAETAEVLADWQGLGYNRRALALKRLSQQVSDDMDGILPADYEQLQLLPGVGPATAAGVMAFAHNVAAPYLETNVRSVVLHELFANYAQVCDRDVMAVVKQAAECVHASNVDARTWNYALLDYGAWLKKAYPNPSRRSKQHTRQSKFEGSFRQKRATVLRQILDLPGQDSVNLATICNYSLDETEKVLSALSKEGFIVKHNGTFSVAD